MKYPTNDMVKKQIEYSVIIPTADNADNLAKCLHHLSEIENPKKMWEVIVVNNAKTKSTKKIVEKYKKIMPLLHYFHSSQPGLMVGRHVGCDKAKGSILCFIDDDSLVSKGWLKGVKDAFCKDDVVLVGGPNLPEYKSNPPAWLESFWEDTEYGRINGYLSLIDFGDKIKEISPLYVYGCNYSIRKEIFLKVGGSNPDNMPKELQRFQGDGETSLSRKLMRRGYKAIYHPEVKIRHLVSDARITSNYFYERGYYQGVCNSFSRIRRKKGLDEYMIQPRWKSFPRKIMSLYNKLKIWLRIGILKQESADVKKIRDAVNQGVKDGFQFHQREASTDPQLLEYVLRDNFLGENMKIPSYEN